MYGPVAAGEGPHLGVLWLEAGLPQAFEVDGVDSHQAGQRRVQHVRFDQAGDVTWINMQRSDIRSGKSASSAQTSNDTRSRSVAPTEKTFWRPQTTEIGEEIQILLNR